MGLHGQHEHLAIGVAEGDLGLGVIGRDALFLPATARHIFTDAFRAATLHVHVELPPLAEPRPRLVAADVAVRQRRRKTWAQNVDRYALPTGTEIRVEVAGNPTLRRMLGEFMRSPSPAVHAG